MQMRWVTLFSLMEKAHFRDQGNSGMTAQAHTHTHTCAHTHRLVTLTSILPVTSARLKEIALYALSLRLSILLLQYFSCVTLNIMGCQSSYYSRDQICLWALISIHLVCRGNNLYTQTDSLTILRLFLTR